MLEIIKEEKKFKITVEEVKTVNYKAVETSIEEERHYTDAEFEKMQYVSNENKKIYTKKLYGNSPCIKTKDSKETILELVVSQINLPSLAEAIFKAQQP